MLPKWILRLLSRQRSWDVEKGNYNACTLSGGKRAIRIRKNETITETKAFYLLEKGNRYTFTGTCL